MGMSSATRGRAGRTNERSTLTQSKAHFGPVRHYEKKWVPHGHIMVLKWVTEELDDDRHADTFDMGAAKGAQKFVNSALASGRVTRGLVANLQDVDPTTIGDAGTDRGIKRGREDDAF